VSKPEFDLDRPLALDGKVALRPEPFGALAYHFGTRRLSFIKTRKLLAVVEGLGEHPSGRAACVAAGVTEPEMPAYAQALSTLAASGMIGERAGA
jgi:mycofactocin biosynthesis protein MftB